MAAALAALLPQGIIQFTDANGAPLSGGSVAFYVPNTTTLKTVWADPGEAVALQNPVPLDSAGRPQTGSSEVEIYGSGQYSMLVKDAYGNIIYGPVLTQDALSLAESLIPPGIMVSVASIAALRALNLTTPAQTVVVEGFYAAQDGGGGIFTLGAPGVDNGVNIITSNNGTYYLSTFGNPISILQLGCKGDGTTNDAISLAVLPSVLPDGGTVVIPAGRNFYIGTTVTIPTAITFQGPYEFVGELTLSHTVNEPWPSFVTFTIASTATIGLDASCSITGCLIYRSGMTFPTTSNSAFAGTAFIINGDDVMFRNSLIMGFNYAIAATNCDRIMIEDMSFDNNNNIAITNANDTCKIARCHAWPFSADAPSQTGLTRSGANIQINASTDATMISDCFAFGYAYGFLFNDAQGATCVNCDVDGPATATGIGFYSQGTGANSRVQLVACQTYVQQTGIYYSNTGGAGALLTISDCTIAGCATGISVAAAAVGVIRLHGSALSSCSFAVLVTSANVSMDIDDNSMLGIANPPITSTVATNNLNIGSNNRFGLLGDTTAGLLVTPATVSVYEVTPAAGALALPVVGNVFFVAPGQNFGTLGGIWVGRVVTLVFGGVNQVFSSNGTPTSMQLAGGATYTTASGNTLTLVHTGSGQWYEVSRG